MHIFSEGEGQTEGDLNNESPPPMDFLLKTDAISGSLLVVDFLESLHG